MQGGARRVREADLAADLAESRADRQEAWRHVALRSHKLRRALIRQTSELLYEVLRWPKGRFTFSKATIEQPDVARLGLPVASIVMEGFRRVDEWRLVLDALAS